MAALSAMVRCLWLGILLRGADAYTARKPSIAGKSVYFLVTDRFARSGANKDRAERNRETLSSWNGHAQTECASSLDTPV